MVESVKAVENRSLPCGGQVSVPQKRGRFLIFQDRSLWGEIQLLLSHLPGVLGFVVLWAYNLSFQTFLREDRAFIGFITSRRFLVWALLLGGVHVFFMGIEGWLRPAGWHGGMPPISLVAFTVFVIAYGANLAGRR